MSLVLWIADRILKLRDLLAYVDDNFSWELAHRSLFYRPYQCYFPEKQAQLLYLWDQLCIPHEERKQEFGPVLTIIGYRVDTIRMEITMDDSYKSDLLAAVDKFCEPSNGRHHSLREFQCLVGWINWGLNVQPRLRPGLASMYEKMSGKEQPHQLMWVNTKIRNDFTWLASYYAAGSGVFLLDAIAWGPLDADLVVFTDVSSIGLGIWIPKFNTVFPFKCPTSPSAFDIFFFEAYVTCCAIHLCTHLPIPLHRLAVFSNSKNTVEMFNMMRAHGTLNHLLRFAVDVLMQHELDLHVYHIPGEKNIVADTSSCFKLNFLYKRIPNILILSYMPPPHLDEALRA